MGEESAIFRADREISRLAVRLAALALKTVYAPMVGQGNPQQGICGVLATSLGRCAKALKFTRKIAFGSE